MVIHWCRILVFFYVILLIPLVVTECPYKECYCIETNIYCEEKSLSKLQLVKNNITGFTTLTLEDNSLTTIPAQSLPPNLTDISIKDNPLITIEDSAFDDSATTLRKLIISRARLTRIPDAFKRLTNIQELHLEEVPITDWNIDAMKKLGSTLKYFYLYNAQLTISQNWLQYFSRLVILSISGGSLNSLPDNSLDLVTNSLTSLTISNTNITVVPKALSKINSLQTLILSYNKITSTKWLPDSRKLLSLALNGNKIFNASELSTAIRPFEDSLTNLNIEENSLTSIPDISFLQIEKLSFRYNKLSDPISGSLPPKLSFLDLEYNNLPRIPQSMSRLQFITDLSLLSNSITEIQGTDFAPAVKSVDLAYNLITELTDNSFPENSVIESLYLDNNPLSRMSALAFKHLSRLKVLSLERTKLTRLPLALTSLGNLTSFDVLGTTGLVCTCLEKGIGSLLLPLGPENVLGDCGQMSIYTFFSTLSPSCPLT